MITENYSSHTKDELLTEATSRGLDVTGSSTKADIVAALEADDGSATQGNDDATGLPDVEDESNLPEPAPLVPKNSDYKGRYTRKGDGEPYALAIIKEGGEYGRTHFAKNKRHFWSGSEEEFKLEFEKE